VPRPQWQPSDNNCFSIGTIPIVDAAKQQDAVGSTVNISLKKPLSTLIVAGRAVSAAHGRLIRFIIVVLTYVEFGSYEKILYTNCLIY
jgi:hypothetical protein